jgi:vanillate/3-O-methylgallate O-demethylase
MTATHEPSTKAAANLQEAIDQAGSPVRLLWKPNVAPWLPPVLEDEYVGWPEEQSAPYETVAFSDQSHHMSDLFIEGPDATRMLSELSPNDYDNFAIGQAKQFIAVTERGQMIGDDIILRQDREKYTITGVPAAQDWVSYHADRGGYDVELRIDPPSDLRGREDPVQFRYEVEGPRAHELVQRVFGGPLPETKFFHSTPVTLEGRHFRALRHGMSGQGGYEFIGDWKDGAFVKERFMEEREAFGIVEVGAKAYAGNAVESGWLAFPVPAIYSDPTLKDYRESLGVFSFEGQLPLHGSFLSENIEDYYCSPFELGYGKIVKFNHDFRGRDALERTQNAVLRKKVTVVLDPEDLKRVLGEVDYYLTFGQYRVEVGSELVGIASYGTHVARHGTILFLALVDSQHAEPGTEVTFIWGEHPGPGADSDRDVDLKRIKATVQPAPYDEFARTRYRQN